MTTTPVSIILPTLNESGNLIPLVKRLISLIKPREIIIVDDNSTDGTILEAENISSRNPNIKVIVNRPSIGLTKSIQKGIDHSTSPLIAWMDADFSHPPQTLKKMLEEMKNADIVVGSWLIKGGHDNRYELTTRIMSLIINKLCRSLFDHKITAYTSGFILCKRSIFKDFNLRGDYGEYCLDFLVKMTTEGYHIVEVPFRCFSRKKGKSKTAPNLLIYFKRGIKYLLMIISLYPYILKQ